MDVFNKLKSTVSSLSTVLPGNPVTREYDVGKHVASAGSANLWKIYEATKKSTKQEASVFVLDKKLLDKYPKHLKDKIIENLKSGVAKLTKLRHPSILTIQHPLEESRDSLAFAAEPVFSSIANILGNHENLPNPFPTELKEFQLYDVEIKYGFFQMAEGLAFLHNDAKILHRNLCPESIIINKCGAWKIFGLDFSVAATNSYEQQYVFPSLELENGLPPLMYPNLEHLAPEYVLTKSCSMASDMFSLGALMLTIYNKGETLYNCIGNPANIKNKAEKLKNLAGQSQLNSIPPEALEHVKLTLNIIPEVRPDAHQFSKLNFFNDLGVKTLQFLDSLYQLDNLQKSQFFKGLPQVLLQTPKRVSIQRVLPSLVKEYVNPEMIPFVLPNILLIAEQSTREEFQKYILPDLIPVFKLQEPIQILLIFMQKMELLLTKCNPEDIRNHILPMVNASLEADAQQIQELCLNVIPTFASLIEYHAMKNSLIPRIKKICLNTNYLSVRVNTLVCLGKLLEHLDKWLVLDDILPMLTQIPSKEPAVLMGILGIYKLALDHKKLGITKDVMAGQIIPFLMPLSIENGLTLNQFNSLMNVIKDMVNRVETEQKSKLQQLNSIRDEQRSTLDMTKVSSMKPNEIIPDLKENPSSAMDEMFQGLGLGGYINQSQEKKPSQPISSYNPKTINLTMDEKEKLAKDQETHQRLKTQPPILNPTSIPTLRKTPEPKDLTSTLINSNLSGLTNNPSMSMGNFMPQMSYGVMPQVNQVQTGYMGYRMPQTQLNYTPVPNRPVWNSYGPNQTVQNSFVPSQTQPNMSALDNMFTEWKSASGTTSNGLGPVVRTGGMAKTETNVEQTKTEGTIKKTSFKDLEDLLG